MSGLLIDIGLITKNDKTFVVDRSKMQRQTKKVQDLLRHLRQEEVQALLGCLMFDSAMKKCQVVKMVNGKPVHVMGKRDLYALVDGAGKYSPLFNSNFGFKLFP